MRLGELGGRECSRRWLLVGFVGVGLRVEGTTLERKKIIFVLLCKWMVSDGKTLLRVCD